MFQKDDERLLSTSQNRTVPQDVESQFPAELILARDSLFNADSPDSPTADQVIQYAEVLHLSQDGAWNWLRRPCRALAARPIDLWTTPVGCEHVMRILYAQYHSVYQ
jgi:hypothetical protein